MKDADSGVSRGGQRVALPGLALLLAALYLAAAVSSARRKSATFDETAHLAAGISYWKTGDFRMNPEHPPLVKLIAGAFALAGGGVRFEPRRASDGAILAAWEDGEQYTFGSWLLFRENDGPRLLFRARLAMILIGLSGLAAAAGWARELARGAGGGAGAAGRRSRRGAWAALAAAAFLAFYPEYTGHARWVTFDVPAAAACAGASLLFWRWFRRPSPGRAAAFLGVAVAGALAKLTALLFLAPLAAGGAAAAWILARRRGAGGGAPRKSLFRRRGFGAQAALWGAFALALWAGAWAVYGFRFTLTAPDQPALARTPEFLSFRDSAPERQGFVNHIARALWRARLAPEAAIAVLQHTQTFGGRQAFLRGRMSREGFPDYFFWTVLYKTPLLYLALGAFAFFEAARALWRRRGNNAPPSKRERLRRMGAGLFLAWPFLALFALSAASRVNLGHRYIVFIYIPWCVALGLLCARWGAPPSPRWQRAAALLAPAAAAAIFSPHGRITPPGSTASPGAPRGRPRACFRIPT